MKQTIKYMAGLVTLIVAVMAFAPQSQALPGCTNLIAINRNNCGVLPTVVVQKVNGSQQTYTPAMLAVDGMIYGFATGDLISVDYGLGNCSCHCTAPFAWGTGLITNEGTGQSGQATVATFACNNIMRLYVVTINCPLGNPPAPPSMSIAESSAWGGASSRGCPVQPPPKD